jgi:divalent metal cation (Fe/Co/Zn/Cd) transporter
VQSVRVRSVGAAHFADVIIDVPRSLGIEQVTEVKERTLAAVRSVLTDADVTVQSQPVSPSNETVRERILLVAQRESAAVHHITVQHLPDRLALALDLEVDGGLALADAHHTADRLEVAIRSEFGRDAEIEIHIEPLEPDLTDVEDTPETQRQSYVRTLEESAHMIDGLSDVHNVRLRHSARGTVLVAHCRFAPEETVESVHRRVDDLERLVRAKKPEVARIVIHAEPIRSAPPSPPSPEGRPKAG